LDLDDVIGKNHIHAKQKNCLPFNLEVWSLSFCKHGLLNPTTEETNEKDARHVNSLEEMDKTLATLEAIPMRLNWGENLLIVQ